MSNPSSYQAWAPGSYVPRPSAPEHHQEQSPQAVRLPPPASLVAGAPSGRVPPNPQPAQYPKPSPTYQDPYVVSSTAQLSPPQSSTSTNSALAPRYMAASHPEQTRRSRLEEEAHASRVLYSAPTDRTEGFQDPRYFNIPRGPETLLQPRSEPSLGYSQHHTERDTRMEPPQQPRQQIPQGVPTFRSASASIKLRRPEHTQSQTRPDPAKIPNILGCSGQSGGTDVTYRLNIRQQPVAARSCGFGERDRRVIDPPPIVELVIEGPDLTEEEISARRRYCHYVMSCSIYDESGHHDASFMPEEYKQSRRLMGSLVGAPFVGQDEHGKEGCFFCFPDLSCRTPGSFRLKFSLVMIDPVRARELRHFPILVEAKSDVFTVYNAKDFPGMQASTKLTKRLKEQGCIISIKKGNDKAKNAKGFDDISDEDDDEGESSQNKRRRYSARQ